MLEILRMKHIVKETQLSRSTILRYVRKGLFPKPFSLGDRAIGWDRREVDAWLETKLEERG